MGSNLELRSEANFSSFVSLSELSEAAIQSPEDVFDRETFRE